MKRILIILTNYLRPENMPQVLMAWHKQTLIHQTQIVIVDNSPLMDPSWKQGDIYPDVRFNHMSDVWRIGENLGCSCRLYAALALAPDHDYVLFADDDYTPGTRAVEHLCATVALLEGQFATIGVCGRELVLSRSGHRYDAYKSPLRSTQAPVACHITCRLQFFRADQIIHALTMRDRIIKNCGDEGKFLVRMHDDVLLCSGIQQATGWQSYLTPLETSPEHKAIQKELPDHGVSVWKRPGHFEERNRIVELAIQCGWEPKVLACRI